MLAPEAVPMDQEDGRLPTALEPTHYVLELQPHIYGPSPTFTSDGHVDVFFTCREATNQIVLNSVAITIVDGSLELDAPSDPGGTPAIVSWELVPASNYFIIYLDGDLTVGEDYVFRVSFGGIVTQSNPGLGLYWDSYEEDGQTK